MKWVDSLRNPLDIGSWFSSGFKLHILWLEQVASSCWASYPSHVTQDKGAFPRATVSSEGFYFYLAEQLTHMCSAGNRAQSVFMPGKGSTSELHPELLKKKNKKLKRQDL